MIAMRVLLTEDEGRKLLCEQFPLEAEVEREVKSTKGTLWVIVKLDREFAYQVPDANTGGYKGFTVTKFAIRSRWQGYDVGGVGLTSVFVLFTDDESRFDAPLIDVDEFYFEGWAMCQKI